MTVTRRYHDPILIALGANLPVDGQAPADTLRAALAALPGEGLEVAATSRLFATPCFPPGAGPDYVNAAARLEAATDLAPREILAALHRVEARFRRTRDVRWGQRTLDLDLLAMGETLLPDAETATRWRDLPPEHQVGETPDRLILPHPRLQDRAFVLVPLLDVAPDWRHPALGLAVRELAARLPAADRESVRVLDGA